MKLLSLRIQNFGGVELLELDTGGQSAMLAGPNGSGKTSVLNALISALGGKVEDKPSQPMRAGATETKVDVLIEGFSVHRVWRAGKAPRLKVTDESGVEVSSPQRFLDALIPAGIAFRPLDFVRQHPTRQREQLLKACGISLDDLEASRKESYDARRDANVRVKTLTAQRAALPEVPADAPTEPIDVAGASRELDAARQRIQAYVAWEQRRNDLADRLEEARAALRRVNAEVEALDAAKPRSAPDDAEEASRLAARLQQAGEINRQVDLAQRVRQLDRAIAMAESDALSAQESMDAVDAAKAELLAEAQIVPGLDIREDGIYLSEVELSAVNTQQQIELALAVSARMQPHLRLALLDGAEALDDESWARVLRMAEERDIQLLATRVESGNGLSFEIVVGGGDDE